MTFYQIAFLFFTYSFLGWVGEVVFTAAVHRKYQDRGVLSGPLCILYGVGGLVITFALRDLSRDSWFFLFVFSAVYATVVEWIGGHILEWTTHTRWWDYSAMPFNLDGYICLGASATWGALGVVLLKWGNPLLLAVFALVPHGVWVVLLWASLALLSVDLIGTLLAMAGLRYRWPAAEAIENRLANLTVRGGMWILDHVERRMAKAHPALSFRRPQRARATGFAACLLYTSGYLAQMGTTTATQLSWISSGFWGALVAGFAAGIVIRWLNFLFRRTPQELDYFKNGLLIPLLSLLFVGTVMVMFVNPPLGRFNNWLSIQLSGMRGGSRLVLGALLGSLMATDYGGPLNKAAYVTGTLALVSEQYDIMAAVMAGGMIPPIGVALACLLFPTRFTQTERRTVPQNLLMGASFVTEGALPFALKDPLRTAPACMAGSALAGFLAVLFNCGCPAPHGGLFLLPVINNPLGFLTALGCGSLLTTTLLGILKKPLKH